MAMCAFAPNGGGLQALHQAWPIGNVGAHANRDGDFSVNMLSSFARDKKCLITVI
jgi:hypothetical protein